VTLLLKETTNMYLVDWCCPDPFWCLEVRRNSTEMQQTDYTLRFGPKVGRSK